MGKVLEFPKSGMRKAKNAREGVLEIDVYSTPIGYVELVLKHNEKVYLRHNDKEYETNIHVPELIDVYGAGPASMILMDVVQAFVDHEMAKMDSES